MLPNADKASLGDEPVCAPCEPVKGKLARLVIVLGGIVLGQAVLYGPSLAGRKILLPLDILAEPFYYLPRTPEVAKIEPQNTSRSDMIDVSEPARRFAAAELHAGRLPMWTPYNFAGAPFIWPKFSPFLALQCATASPVVLAWSQLLAAIVAGLGAYLFCRRVLVVSFWPAAIAAWCYPLTGFFVLWQGYPTCLPVVWLPWILLAVDQTARGASALAPVGLSAVTCLVLVSGQLDVAGQVLLASGLYGLWRLYEAHPKQWFQRQGRKAALGLTVAWGLGFLLAAPYLLPVLEYTHTGFRMARRAAGEEERPPVGLAALPQTVLPYMYGTRQTGSLRIESKRDNEMESSAAAYTGVLATLLVAPLAWCSRRHRSMNLALALLSFLSLSWCLNVPGYVDLLRLPGLNMMSHNRLVFVASFAILAMMAVGLEVFLQGPVHWRWWLWLPATLLAGLCVWCIYRAIIPPEPIATRLTTLVQNGYGIRWIHDLDGVRRVQSWFARYYTVAAVLCGMGVLGWLLLWARRPWQVRLLPVLGVLLVGDLLWFARGRSAQCDSALYYPPIPVLEQVAQSIPGRIIGYNCLPASFASMRGLRDIRGYDAVDPARLVALAALAADPQSESYPYALMRKMTPRARLGSQGEFRLSPVLDMLGVRYVIGRGSPLPNTHPAFQGTDYWVLVNSNALARTFVPHRVETEAEDKARLAKLAAEDFDPREVAYVESPVDLPGPCRGTVSIVEEIPTRIRVSVQMETPGLVVLADLWDKGWQAYLNGQRVPILRTNHAIRGVVVPAGSGMLEFRYAPASFAWGLRLSGLAAIALLVWLGIALRRRRTEG
ncbi:MAG: hypothetical protein ABSD29_15730 [Verrucomicrobiota bacterium]|jgi:hypothetical protein